MPRNPYAFWRMRVYREWRVRRTHEPCVPTGQVNLPHGITHSSLLPTSSLK